MATHEELTIREINDRARADLAQKHIVFVGFMGAGKSTLAELTGRRLGRTVYDTDKVISQRAGRTIVELFRAGQEERFRAMEAEVVMELMYAEPSVIALGGGTLDNQSLRAIVFEKAFVVNLAVTWREVKQSLPQLRLTRPLLQDRSDAEVHELFLRRQHTYRSAHLRLSVLRGEPAASVEYLLSVFGGTEDE